MRVSRKKWVTADEGSLILTQRHGRSISPAYVRRLAALGHIQVHPLGKSFNYYSGSDCRTYQIRQHKKVTEEAS